MGKDFLKTFLESQMNKLERNLTIFIYIFLMLKLPSILKETNERT